MRYLLLPVLLAGAATLPAFQAHAQSPSDGAPHGFIATGIAVVPEYDGASDLTAAPFILGDVNWGGATFQFRGSQLRVDLAPDSRLSYGPVLGLRMARDDADGAVGLLPELDTAVEAGGFIAYRFGGDERGQGALRTEFSILHDVSGVYDGVVVSASASYAAISTGAFSLSVDAQTTWVSSDYAETYFGVTPAASQQSGLPAFSAGSGFRDIGVGLTAAYWFTERFGVTGRVGANYLVGDSADSPITEDGSRWQPLAGIAAAYRF